VAEHIVVIEPGSRRGVGIRWLGQSGFVLEGGGLRVLIDPWLSDHELRTSAPDPLDSLPPGIMWLLASHEHADHLDLPALLGLLERYPKITVVVPAPLAERVRDAVPRATVVGIQPAEMIAAGSTTIHGATAWHGVTVEEVYTDGRGLRSDGQTPFVGYVIEFPEATVYHGGDTILGAGMVEELSALHIDIALLPINGRDAERESAGILGNLDAAEAVDLAERLGARVIVPMHFDMVGGNTASPDPMVDLAQGRPLSVVLPVRGQEIFVSERISPE
jgi:L-ascorbate 6-phosphate lactonase